MSYRSFYKEDWSINVVCKNCNKLLKVSEKDLFIVTSYSALPSEIKTICSCKNKIFLCWGLLKNNMIVPDDIQESLFFKYKNRKRWWQFWK